MKSPFLTFEIKGFSKNIDEMSHKAIIVEQLAWLFSQTIKEVLIGGFENIYENAQSYHADSHEQNITDLNKALSRRERVQQLSLEGPGGSNSASLESQVRLKV